MPMWEDWKSLFVGGKTMLTRSTEVYNSGTEKLDQPRKYSLRAEHSRGKETLDK